MDVKETAFPTFSHYNLCIKYFVEKALSAEYIMQPPMTNRTLYVPLIWSYQLSESFHGQNDPDGRRNSADTVLSG